MKFNYYRQKLFFSFLLSLSACSLSGQEVLNCEFRDVPPGATDEQVLRLATEVRPSPAQLDYQEREMLGFIHIGMNTFTGREWGTGTESPSIFNPDKLDADAWIKAYKEAGITAVIFVAKHHDGFCVWPTKYSDHSIAHSPWKNGKGDMVREVSDACRKYGVKFCLYLSPWDMHEPTYGTDAYNDHYIRQMEELLTNYGPVYLLWFDGAGTSSSVSGKNMRFDWERIFRRARELQPGILLSGAPDIRWVGNEAGKGRETEWCVQGINDYAAAIGARKGHNTTAKELASIEDLRAKQRLIWYPSRAGLPLRKGWFYKPEDDYTTKSLAYLVDCYFSSIGQNSNVLLNLSPDTHGLIPERDSKRLIEFGKIIQKMKEVDYAKGAKVKAVSGWTGRTNGKVITDADPFTSWNTAEGTEEAVAEITLKRKATVNVIKLQENVRDFGQRVERFAVDAWLDGRWTEVGASTTIGYRKMLRLKEAITTDRFRVRFQDARLSISWGNFSLYYIPDIPQETNDLPQTDRLPKENWTVTTRGLSGKSTDSLKDGDAHTYWEGKMDRNAGEIVIQLPESSRIGAMSYLPVESDADGYIDYYELYVSQNGVDWGTPVAQGRFGNIQANPVEQLVTFQKKEARYIRLVIKSVIATDGKFRIAELSFYK